jgi:hypothetical protein
MQVETDILHSIHRTLGKLEGDMDSVKTNIGIVHTKVESLENTMTTQVNAVDKRVTEVEKKTDISRGVVAIVFLLVTSLAGYFLGKH